MQSTFLTRRVPSVIATRRMCAILQLRPRRNSSPPFLLIPLANIFFVSLNLPKAQTLGYGNIQGSRLECSSVDFSFYTAILSKLIIYPCVYKYHFYVYNSQLFLLVSDSFSLDFYIMLPTCCSCHDTSPNNEGRSKFYWPFYLVSQRRGSSHVTARLIPDHLDFNLRLAF